MSSNYIYSVRRFSGDPAAQRFKQLSERLAQFEAATLQAQTGDLKNFIKVTNSINQYKEQDIVSQKIASTTFAVPLEPDGKLLTCWFKFDSWGKVVRDAAFMGNNGTIMGQTPTSAVGPDKGLGSSVAMNFDGSSQFIEVKDNSNIRLVGQQVGFTVAVLIQPQTFTLTGTGESRYIAEKTDDVGDLWGLFLDTSGLIHFNVKFGGVDYSKVTSTATPPLNTWTWVVCTFNVQSKAIAIYTAAVSRTLSSSTVADADYNNVPTNLYVGATSVNDGFFDGWIADFRYYREKVLTQAEVTNLNTTNLTTSTITAGSVAAASQFALPVHTTSSFTSKFTSEFF